MEAEAYQKTQTEIIFICGLLKKMDLDAFVNEIQRAQTHMKLEKDPAIYKIEFEKKQLIEEVAVRLRQAQRSANLLEDFLLKEKGVADG